MKAGIYVSANELIYTLIRQIKYGEKIHRFC